ncbi:MAG TPA: NAD(P)-binding protein [Gemmataceae bacterium]|jgi:choline dehydrogenase-like flavoprotein
MSDLSYEEKHYDYIVVGAGAAGSVLAAELSAPGAQVLVIESGGPDDREPERLVLQRGHLPARVHLPRGASESTGF